MRSMAAWRSTSTSCDERGPASMPHTAEPHHCLKCADCQSHIQLALDTLAQPVPDFLEWDALKYRIEEAIHDQLDGLVARHAPAHQVEHFGLVYLATDAPRRSFRAATDGSTRSILRPA